MKLRNESISEGEEQRRKSREEKKKVKKGTGWFLSHEPRNAAVDGLYSHQPSPIHCIHNTTIIHLNSIPLRH
jgi:hypothetical protein